MLEFKQITSLRKKNEVSERGLARIVGMSRITVRKFVSGDGNPTLRTVEKLAKGFGRKACVLLEPDADCWAEMSTVAVSMRTAAGEDWKIAFFDLVDALRSTLDYRLVLLPPVRKLADRPRALLASMVCELCHECGFTPPSWADRTYFLDQPWFVAGMRSLKACAIQESPLCFRRNNIFVLANFMHRV
ncbi:MAG: helix-turn-helix transcriptional regulator [Elusimicrobiota bacterium]